MSSSNFAPSIVPNMKTRFLFSLAVLAVAALGFATAEEVDLSAHKVTHVTWGDAIEGDERPAFKKEELNGKVVVVEEFGVKIPDCLSRIKDLSRLAKKHARDASPLAIVMIHRQREVPDKEILEAIERVPPSVIVRKNGFLPVYHEGMPNAAVFGADGEMVWTGDPSNAAFGRALKAALKKAGK